VVQPKGAAAQQGIAAVGMELAGSSLRSLADLAGPQQNSETLGSHLSRGAVCPTSTRQRRMLPRRRRM
jgi:hypothetical protein